MRLGRREFRVVTGALTGMTDAKWIADHLPDDARLSDVTSAVGHARVGGDHEPGTCSAR